MLKKTLTISCLSNDSIADGHFYVT